MEAAYDDGIKGLVCQGEVTQYDENGVTFESINGFGYYVSINRGYKKEIISIGTNRNMVRMLTN